MKKFRILCILTACGLLSGSFVRTATAAEGLTVQNGVVMKDGVPFRAIGVNAFDAFTRNYDNWWDHGYRDTFRMMAENHIPYARIMLCGFWPSQVKLYLENKETYFQWMDDVVKSAEANHVGIIADLFWCNFAVSDVVGEPLDEWGQSRQQDHRVHEAIHRRRGGTV